MCHSISWIVYISISKKAFAKIHYDSDSVNKKMRLLPKKSRSLKASVVYIKAAIEEATGHKLTHDQVIILLLQEGLITLNQVGLIDVPDLNKYGSSYTPTEKIYDTSLIPVDVVVKDWPSLFIDKRVENERD